MFQSEDNFKLKTIFTNSYCLRVSLLSEGNGGSSRSLLENLCYPPTVPALPIGTSLPPGILSQLLLQDDFLKQALS